MAAEPPRGSGPLVDDGLCWSWNHGHVCEPPQNQDKPHMDPGLCRAPSGGCTSQRCPRTHPPHPAWGLNTDSRGELNQRRKKREKQQKEGMLQGNSSPGTRTSPPLQALDLLLFPMFSVGFWVFSPGLGQHNGIPGMGSWGRSRVMGSGSSMCQRLRKGNEVGKRLPCCLC